MCEDYNEVLVCAFHQNALFLTYDRNGYLLITESVKIIYLIEAVMGYGQIDLALFYRALANVTSNP